MDHCLLVTRTLPLPEIVLHGRPVRYVVLGEQQPEDTPQVLLATALDRIDAEILTSLPDSVGLIAGLGIGTDHIDLAAAKAHGLLVSNTPVGSEDTADLAFALILATCRNLRGNEQFVRSGQWIPSNLLATPASRVHGKSLGLVGFGLIGQGVARRATGFGMPTRYWNRIAKPEVANELGADYEPSLERLLETSDIVSLHLALTPETHHLIGAPQLAQMKPGSMIINTARGALIDEQALITSLKQGRPVAAGLDVFEHEPTVPEALLNMDNVVLTPHAGSATTECRGEILQRGLANVQAFLETGQPLDGVEF